MEKCLKDVVVVFTAHLSLTIKPLTRKYKKVVVLATMLEGKVVRLQHGGQYELYNFVEKIKLP